MSTAKKNVATRKKSAATTVSSKGAASAKTARRASNTKTAKTAKTAKTSKTESAAKLGSSKRQTKGPKAFDPALLDRLLEEATRVRENAYAPFSNYRVGAALATRDGRVFAGCNVENSTYGATICAERGAVMQMIAAGAREPVACVIVTSDGGSPCGICRQVLAEFTEDMPVVLANLEDETGKVVQLADLLPLAFRLEH
jgi:cytidine deaminase